MAALLLSTALSVMPSAPALRAASVLQLPNRGTLPCMAAAGTLQRLTVGVADATSCVKFYTDGLGLSTSESADGSILVGGEAGPQLELRHVEGAAYQPDGGFQGVSLCVPSVASAVESAKACGGTVVSEPGSIEHGPSWKPVDEPDEMTNDIVEAIVADPSGYPVLLHEVEGAATAVSGVRCECHVWKKSQEWYEALGWRMLRYNSNVHRESSLTITLGSEGDHTGPRGSPGQGVVQLTYKYGNRPVAHAGGLEAIVLSTDGDAQELTDPDGYVIRLE